jgi:hypothetical protein
MVDNVFIGEARGCHMVDHVFIVKHVGGDEDVKVCGGDRQSLGPNPVFSDPTNVCQGESFGCFWIAVQEHNNTTTQQHNNTTTQQHNNTTTRISRVQKLLENTHTTFSFALISIRRESCVSKLSGLNRNLAHREACPHSAAMRCTGAEAALPFTLWPKLSLILLVITLCHS